MGKTSRKFKEAEKEGKTVKELAKALKEENRPVEKIDLWKYLGIKHINDLDKDELGIKRL